jgi:kynureninase
MKITRERLCDLDRSDPLAFARERFCLPGDVVYLDGNSLGALPSQARAAMARAVAEEWGDGLIRSWNRARWVDLPARIGRDIARLLGAAADEVVVADSTSVNLYKLVAGECRTARRRDPKRRLIVSERGNFPTDLYIAEGLAAGLQGGLEMELVDGGDESGIAARFGPHVAVALLTQVDYRSGRVLDMRALNEAARRHGHRIVWDLSHSAGALALDLHADGVELAVGCGYKYLNGGPGAPAWLYVAKDLQREFPVALSGWFGHRRPFDFTPAYEPAEGIARLQCGTPPVLALRALEAGVASFEGVDLREVRAKSLRLTDIFLELMHQHAHEFGFACVSPREHVRRGSQLAFTHPHAWPIMQALIERGVIGDYREPNLMRFGFTPLTLRYVELWDAVMILREVMLSGAWKATRHGLRNTVT